MMVYIDLLILSNFLLDYSILLFTGCIARTDTKWYRILLATCIAISSVCLFYIGNIVIFLILRVLYSFLIVYIAFGYRNFKKYCIHVLLFYTVNYLMAGILISFNISSNFINIDFFNIRTWLLLIISFILAHILTYTLKVQAFHQNLDIPVKFKILGNDYSFIGFLDTGNDTSVKQMTPVIFINQHCIKESMTEALCIKNNIEYHYIQVNTLQKSGIILAFRPDYFEAKVDYKFRPYDVYLAIFEGDNRSLQSTNVILNKNLLV